MTDYKSTLNLPETAFPMKAGLPQREPEMLARWKEIDLYQKIREVSQGRRRFILHRARTPPKQRKRSSSQV